MINISSYEMVENEHLYGPGKRLLVFTQGCSLHCKGCVNQHLWPFGNGENVSTSNLVALCESMDGITLHGGEPLDQAEGVLELVTALKEQGKTIVLFTGYTFSELNTTQRKIWLKADMVIAGRYDETKRNIYLQFRGSTNQKVITHKGKYKNYAVKDGKTISLLALNERGEIKSLGFREEGLEELLQALAIKS